MVRRAEQKVHPGVRCPPPLRARASEGGGLDSQFDTALEAPISLRKSSILPANSWKGRWVALGAGLRRESVDFIATLGYFEPVALIRT
jgi:hypothetical protein